MKSLFIVLALTTAAHADTWVDGSVTYKFSGIDTHFPVAADACKAVKDGTTSTTARSTDNSGELSKIRCHCDDAKKGCPSAETLTTPTDASQARPRRSTTSTCAVCGIRSTGHARSAR